MNTVSVIIPTYNRKSSLRKALASVQKQKNISMEILVVDDGSDDGSGEMIRKDFPSVQYFFQKNQGPAAARNTGIKKSHGKWLAFLDSDDEWMEGKLSAQLLFFEERPYYAINQTEEIWIRNGKRVNPMKKHQKHGGWIFQKCLPLCIISPSAVMMHRRIFDETGLFDESLPACEDYDLWLRVAAKFPVGLIDRPYVTKYGGHADQRSAQFPAMDRFRIQALSKIISSAILDVDEDRAARKMLEQKSAIYIGGALKRKKVTEAHQISRLANLILEHARPHLRETRAALSFARA